MQIVLVEDDDLHAEIAARCLRGVLDQHSLIRLHDGNEALAFLTPLQEGLNEPTAPRLFLLDVNLPGPGGLDILRALRSHAATEMIPVVMLTSSAFEADASQSYVLGADWYLPKPIKRDTLLDIVENAQLRWTNYFRDPGKTLEPIV